MTRSSYSTCRLKILKSKVGIVFISTIHDIDGFYQTFLFFRGEALIIVMPIVGLEIINEDLVLEVVVGSNLVLPIGMWGEGNKRFTNCDLVDINVSIGDQSVAQVG